MSKTLSLGLEVLNPGQPKTKAVDNGEFITCCLDLVQSIEEFRSIGVGLENLYVIQDTYKKYQGKFANELEGLFGISEEGLGEAIKAGAKKVLDFLIWIKDKIVAFLKALLPKRKDQAAKIKEAEAKEDKAVKEGKLTLDTQLKVKLMPVFEPLNAGRPIDMGRWGLKLEWRLHHMGGMELKYDITKPAHLANCPMSDFVPVTTTIPFSKLDEYRKAYLTLQEKATKYLETVERQLEELKRDLPMYLRPGDDTDVEFDKLTAKGISNFVARLVALNTHVDTVVDSLTRHVPASSEKD